MMKEWIAVALGGMLGALLRHALSWGFAQIGPAWLPIATLTANVAGCLAIGWLAQWALQLSLTYEWWAVGLRVGLLGGLTTFSSFALDVVRLWHEHRGFYTLSLILAHLLLGIAAVLVGVSLARMMSPAMEAPPV
jgi:fluoride exporter